MFILVSRRKFLISVFFKMYHFHNQQMYQQNTYQQCFVNIEDAKLHNNNTISETQYHSGLPQITEITTLSQVQNSNEHPVSEVNKNVKHKKAAVKSKKATGAKAKASKKLEKKPTVDTSNFSVEERLVAAVWVHERKHTSSTISEIKHNFRQRFGRDPPSKTTLFAWERKLFSTGNVCDAPRTGRPVHRKKHLSAVEASVRAAPALSLRARARALRLPRSTLHCILRRDLPHAPPEPKPDKPHTATATGKDPAPRRPKQPLPAPPPPPAPPHMHYVMHAMHTQTHPQIHVYTR